MRSVSGACGIADYAGRASPFGVMHIIGNGQSLSVGTNDIPASLTQPFNNKKLFDSLGTASGYIVSQPFATTLSAIPLVAPQRPIAGEIHTYPTNITGESVEIAMANQLSQLALQEGYKSFDVWASCTGISAAAMSVIQKGGSGNSYAAGQYENQAFQHLTPAGVTFGTIAIVLTHGETNAQQDQGNHIVSPAGYLASLVTLQGNYLADCINPLGTLPMLLSQQNAAPGALGGFNTTAAAMLLAAQTMPTLFILTGPKYPFPNDGQFHLSNYRPLGEKYAQFLWNYFKGQDYAPLWPTSITRVGTAVTVNLHVPVQPLVFDTTTIPAAHQSGMWSMWSGGKGFEAYDNPLTVSSATNATPIVVGFTSPHNLATGATYALEGICNSVLTGGNNAANGVWTMTVVDPSHVSLDGSVGNGTYVGGGVGFAPIGITASSISGSSVNLTLARPPTTGLSIAYAEHADAAGYQAFGGPFTTGNVRDSDPFVGYTKATPQSFYANWLVEFVQAVP